VCSTAAGTVSFIGAGTCIIDANQAGNGDYDPAVQQQQSFTVVKPPSARISSPANGQTFALGQRVVTNFSCAEGTDGPGLSACTDASGAQAPSGVLDTSRLGTFTYRVSATSQDGQSTSSTISYRVTLPSNRLVARPRLKPHSDGTFIVTVKVPGPGRVDILVTAWNNNVARVTGLLQPAPGRFVFACAHATASTAKTLKVVVHPNGKGRRLANHHRYRVTLRLWVTYTPTGGKSRSIGYYGLRLP
jgi:hypothetical protein